MNCPYDKSRLLDIFASAILIMAKLLDRSKLEALFYHLATWTKKPF